MYHMKNAIDRTNVLGKVPVYVRRVANPNRIIRGISDKDGLAMTLAPSERKKNNYEVPVHVPTKPQRLSYIVIKYIVYMN